MLRWLVALVLLLNLGFFAWSRHWLAPVGLAPASPGEPERVQQQIRPEIVTIKPDIPANVPVSAAAAASAAATPADGAASSASATQDPASR